MSPFALSFLSEVEISDAGVFPAPLRLLARYGKRERLYLLVVMQMSRLP